MKTMLTLVAVAAGIMMATAANANPAEDLAKGRGCLKCHTVGEKKVGPPYKDIAAKFKGKNDAEATLAAKLRDGKGHVKAAASEAEIKALVQWVLSAK